MALILSVARSTSFRCWSGIYAKPKFTSVPGQVMKEALSLRQTPQTTAARPLGTFTVLVGKQIVATLLGRGAGQYLESNRVASTPKKLINIMVYMQSAILCAMGYVIYNTKQVKNPVTQRNQFIEWGSDEVDYVTGESQSSVKGRRLSIHSKEWIRLRRIVDAIMWANRDIEDVEKLDIEFDIIDSGNSGLAYSFVLPNGHIYITKKLINSIDSDGELAFVIAHELSHAILKHGRERGSHQELLNYGSYLACFHLGYNFPFRRRRLPRLKPLILFAIPAALLIGLHGYSWRPYSKTMELEADELAQQLITKACFNVNSGVNFLNNPKTLNKAGYSRYYDIHPKYENARVEELKASHDKMVMLHMKKCPDAGELKKFAKQIIKEQNEDS